MYNSYLEDLASHTACNDCTSMMEIKGIQFPDKEIKLDLLLDAAPRPMGQFTVRKFVMIHTIVKTGRHPFLAVAPLEGGRNAIFFSNYPTVECKAIRISTHLPAFMMYSLVLDYMVVPAET